MGWDLLTATLDGSFDVSAKEDIITGVALSPDGTKLFICGFSSDSVHRYDLSTAFDVTTATFIGTLDVSGTITDPTGLRLSSDGAVLLVVTSTQDRVYRYDLSTAWDLSTATLAGSSLLVSGADGSPTGVWASGDGTKLFVSGDANNRVYRYDLSTAWDLSTATLNGTSLDVSAAETSVNGVSLSPDGTKLFIAGSDLHRYDLSTAFDLSTASLTSSAADPFSQELAFSPDGDYMIAAVLADDTVRTYSLNEPPSAPTLVAPTDNTPVAADEDYTFDWDFEAPNTGDSQTGYDLRYRQQGTTPWTTLSATTVDTFRLIAGGTFTSGTTYEWQVRTYGTQSEVGPYSASEFFNAVTRPSAPAIDDPTVDQVIGSEDYTVAWTTATQTAYRVRVVADDGAGAPDTGTVVADTGIVESASARSRSMPFDTNLVTQHVQVQVRHSGLWSDWATVRVDVDYTPPATPTLTLTADAAASSPHIDVDPTQPAPAGAQPTVTSIDVWRRRTADGGDGIRLAAGVDPDAVWADHTVGSGVDYEYRVLATGDNSTSAWSAWTGAATVALEELTIPHPATTGV